MQLLGHFSMGAEIEWCGGGVKNNLPGLPEKEIKNSVVAPHYVIIGY